MGSRHKNTNWQLNESASNEHAIIAVLMDIRDELQELNRHVKAGRWETRRAEEAVVRIDKRLLKNLPIKLKRNRK